MMGTQISIRNTDGPSFGAMWVIVNCRLLDRVVSHIGLSPASKRGSIIILIFTVMAMCRKIQCRWAAGEVIKSG
jgi:hypothetical protein